MYLFSTHTGCTHGAKEMIAALVESFGVIAGQTFGSYTLGSSRAKSKGGAITEREEQLYM